jgi:Family of unknown function (DUF6328)
MASQKHKVTNALNETRTLILGAQILLGFQLNAVFQPAFGRLHHYSRWLDLAALALMSLTVALLIAPAPFHRLTEGGRDTPRVHRFTNRMAEAALFPFGLCIGIDVFIVAELLFGTAWSIVAGAAVSAVAALFWYGLELPRRQRTGGTGMDERRQEEEGRTDLGEKIVTLMTETRVILPGAQALLGFQFAAFLSSGFEELSRAAKLVHFASLVSVALSIILLITPAAYHRLAADGEDRVDVDRFGSAVLLAALFPLGLGLSGAIYVVTSKIEQAEPVALASAAAAMLVFMALWFLYPLLARTTRRSPRGAPAAKRR